MPGRVAEQLNRIENDLDRVEGNLEESEKQLSQLEGCFAFMRRRKARKRAKKAAREAALANKNGTPGGAGGAGGAGKGGAATAGGQQGATGQARMQRILDDEREDEMEANLNVVGDILADLKVQTTQMGTTLDQHNEQLKRIDKKTDRNLEVLDDVNRRTEKLL